MLSSYTNLLRTVHLSFSLSTLKVGFVVSHDPFSLMAGNIICAETPQALLIPSTRVGTLDWVSPQQPAFYLPGCQLLYTSVTSIVSFFPSGQLNGFSEPEDLNLELPQSSVFLEMGEIPSITAFKAMVEHFTDICLWLFLKAEN